jgi:hypothetical protein
MCRGTLQAFIQSQDQTQHFIIFKILYNIINIRSHQIPLNVIVIIILIQLQVPLQLPCYDFTPVIDRNSIRHTSPEITIIRSKMPHFNYYQFPWRDGRCVQNLEHIHRPFLIGDYLRFQLHVFDLQNPIGSGVTFLDLLCLATLYILTCDFL